MRQVLRWPKLFDGWVFASRDRWWGVWNPADRKPGNGIGWPVPVYGNADDGDGSGSGDDGGVGNGYGDGEDMGDGLGNGYLEDD